MLFVARSGIERRRLAHLSLAAVLFVAGMAAGVLYRFPPGAHGFYPVCPVREYLHLECPGCGATRALAALVHGHFDEALRLNALFVVGVLPVAMGWGMLAYVGAIRGNGFRWPQLPTPAVYVGVVVGVAFTVLRNL